MKQFFSLNVEGENHDDIIQQVENALAELKETTLRTQDVFGNVTESLTGTGWDLEVIQDNE